MFCFLSNKTSRAAGERDGGAIVIDGRGKERGDPPRSAVICLTQSLGEAEGQFGLFSPSPMNGCRQGISDGCDKISHPRVSNPSSPGQTSCSGISRVQVNHRFRELVLKDKVRWSRAEMRKYRL